MLNIPDVPLCSETWLVTAVDAPTSFSYCREGAAVAICVVEGTNEMLVAQVVYLFLPDCCQIAADAAVRLSHAAGKPRRPSRVIVPDDETAELIAELLGADVRVEVRETVLDDATLAAAIQRGIDEAVDADEGFDYGDDDEDDGADDERRYYVGPGLELVPAPKRGGRAQS